MSPIFFPILYFLFAIPHGLLAMHTGTISFGQLVPRAQISLSHDSMGKGKNSGVVGSNFSNAVSFLNNRKKKGSTLNMKSVLGNEIGQNFVGNKEKGILTKNNSKVINDHKNYEESKNKQRILNKFNVGKQEFIIRSQI